MSLVTKLTPRPIFATVLAEVIHDEVLWWISKQEARIGKEAFKAFIATLPTGDGPDLFKLLESASAKRTWGEPDAFAICVDLKDLLDWPVDGHLTDIFSKGIKTTGERTLRLRTIEWVLRHGVRFSQKPGTDITFYDRTQNMNRGGKVITVDRPIATGIVQCRDTLRIAIAAEDVVM